ncbi:helix-turn-helix transcriptional regulator [Blautia sp. HA2174]|uniref:helix-turn-helix domain-containing protein n=1 Tax=Blautia sp. HA2174 TaxID=3133036 RepID=UPI00316A2C05
MCFSHSVHPFLDNTILPYIILKIYSRDLIYSILVEERYRQKKTQQEMADITGVRASNIARFEKASRVPTLLMLEKYANALEKHIEIRITEDK